MTRRTALPPLPFQATRQRLASTVRGDAPERSPTDSLGELVAAAGEGIVPLATAAIGPTGTPFRFALSADQAASAATYVAQQARHGTHGLAPNSRRTRAADWLTWLAFCAHYDRVVLPAAFDDVREFLDLLVTAGRKKATIEHMVWSLADIHRRHGCPNPMDSAIARDYWKDLVRERLDGEQAQAAPLTLDVLEQLVAALQGDHAATRRVAPRMQALADHAQQRRRRRDTALLHTAYDLLMRASELVAMTWDRLDTLPGGGATYRLGRTKTDQAGTGRTLYLRPETLQALDAWRLETPEAERIFHAVADDLFLDPTTAISAAERQRWTLRVARAQEQERAALSTREVSAIFRRAAARAGLDPHTQWLSSHSARVGAAQDMVRSGATTAQVQVAGRWDSERMPIRYAERVMARDAGEDRFARLAAMRRGTPKR